MSLTPHPLLLYLCLLHHASLVIAIAAAEILSRLWVVGIIPVLVGAALIFNGMFVSRRMGKVITSGTVPETGELKGPTAQSYLSPPATNELAPRTPFSVVDATTRHLKETPQKPR